jgi:hypothetical protein
LRCRDVYGNHKGLLQLESCAVRTAIAHISRLRAGRGIAYPRAGGTGRAGEDGPSIGRAATRRAACRPGTTQGTRLKAAILNKLDRSRVGRAHA